MTSQSLTYVCLILLIVSCQKTESIEPSNFEEHLFISHTLDRDNNILRDDVKSIPLSNYKSLILGGDLTLDSSEGTDIMDELDNTFDLESSSTLWSLGNHDYTDRDLISEYTERPTYYTYTIGELAFIILDTQRDKSGTIDAQLEMFLSATAGLEGISHLILISHHLIWMDDQGELKNQIEQISNAPFGTYSYCLKSNNFYSNFYPSLVDLEIEGIEVICIAGDIGDKVNKFEHLTDEGIQFLASGLNPNSQKNKALVLEHDPVEKILTRRFTDVDEL